MLFAMAGPPLAARLKVSRIAAAVQDMADTVAGNPALSAAMRATLLPLAPCCWAQPSTTSSTSC